MPRGIAWDELPNRFVKKSGDIPKDEKPTDSQKAVEPAVVRKIDPLEDSIAVGRRVAFGVISGGITGACFGFVDVLRDAKLMAGNRKEGTSKILRFTYRFASFFGAYHGSRKLLKLFVPLSAEMNVAVAAGISITPMIFIPSLRPMIPYSVMMVALDAINGINDV